MIITCEKCETRFNLDDSRIPADGVKVRCSRCKHAFFVQPAASSDAEAADDLARDARSSQAKASAAAANGQTQTLEESDERTQMLDHGSVDFSAGESDEESDWEFNEDPNEESVGGVAPERASDAASSSASAAASDAAFDSAFASAPDLASDPAPDAASDPAGGSAGGSAPGGAAGPAAPERPAAPPRRAPGPALDAAPDADPMNEFLASEEPPSEADGLSMDDLGSPEEWDLLGSEGAAHAEAEPEPAPAPPRPKPAPRPAAAEAKPQAPVEEIQFETPPAAVVEELPLSAGPARTLSSGVGLAAWAVLAVLLALAAWGSLTPPSGGPGGPISAAPTALGELRVDGVEARIVENAVAGPLYVVRGQLHNPGRAASRTGARVHVQLLDGSGSALAEAPVPLALAPSEASLRLDEPELLLARQAEDADALARTSLGPGESIAVAALLPRIPGGARAFRLELGPPVSPEVSLPEPLPDSTSSPESPDSE